MKIRKITPNIFQFTNEMINCFAINDSGITLVDCGKPEHAKSILAAIGQLGFTPADVKRILVTHCHPDHSGGLKEIREATGAAAFMHPLDAAMVREGKAIRTPLRRSHGLFNRILFPLVVKGIPFTVPISAVDTEINDGEAIIGFESIKAIHIPGHCAGQLAFLYRENGGHLFAADACINLIGLATSPHYEDYKQGLYDLKKLASFSFQSSSFGHGHPLLKKASERFMKKFG